MTSTLESLKFLQVAIAHEVDELNKIQRNLSSVEAAALVEWGKFLGGERESMLEDTHLIITQEIQSIAKTKDGKINVDTNLDAMLVIHDRRPKENKNPRGDSQLPALTKPSPAAKITKETQPAKSLLSYVSKYVKTLFKCCTEGRIFGDDTQKNEAMQRVFGDLIARGVNEPLI